MNDAPRKKSPRAPSISLSEAIDGALKIYSFDRRHPIPVELAAKHLGFKTANSGSAIKVLASIRYFGLLLRPEEGKLAVQKEVEDYHFAPEQRHRDRLIRQWLLTPAVFADILSKFHDGLPSDPTLKFELIQRGFLPDGAEALVGVLKSSVEFAHFYDKSDVAAQDGPSLSVVESAPAPGAGISSVAVDTAVSQSFAPAASGAASVDRIPVRLSGGRRAYLEIPTPLFEADKQRLKNQIDLLLTEDDEE